MVATASQIISLMTVYSSVCSGADQRKHQSSASLAFVWGIHRWSVNSPHKWPVTRKTFPFDDVIMHIVCPKGMHVMYASTSLMVTSLAFGQFDGYPAQSNIPAGYEWIYLFQNTTKYHNTRFVPIFLGDNYILKLNIYYITYMYLNTHVSDHRYQNVESARYIPGHSGLWRVYQQEMLLLMYLIM